VEPPGVGFLGLLPQIGMLRNLKRRRTPLPPPLQACPVFPRTARKKTGLLPVPRRQPVAQRWEGYSLSQKRRKILLRVSAQLLLILFCMVDSMSAGTSDSTDDKSKVPGPLSALTITAQPSLDVAGKGDRIDREEVVFGSRSAG